MNDELKERVERLAKEAGFDTDDGEIVAPKCYYQDAMDVRELLERFAQAVARECAKLADDKALEIRLYCNEAHVVAVGAAIRARFGLGE